MLVAPRPTTTTQLLDRYAGFLLDAYGVLVDHHSALPGAAALIAELQRRRLPHAVITNDASRSAAAWAARLATHEISIAPQQILTAGMLLAPAFARRNLHGARTAVLGPDDSVAYARAAGAEIVELGPGLEVDCIVVCDDSGYEFIRGIEWAISAAYRALTAGRDLALLLPNTDLVYPKGGSELGITAGAVALIIEAALTRRFGDAAPRFARLGKPEPHLFDAGRALLEVDDVVVIGDQLETDIVGATTAGMDSALVEGLSRWHPRVVACPTWILPSL
jgi:HAD superfamily hydrolase (TIGR01450 family)